MQYSCWDGNISSLISGEDGGCSRILHYQRRKRSVTAAVWLLALSWRMMGFCTSKFRHFILSTRDYDLFAKVKEWLLGTRYNTRWTRWWCMTPSKQSSRGDKYCKGATVLKVHTVNAVPLWIKPCRKYQSVAITFYPILVFALRCVQISLFYEGNKAFLDLFSCNMLYVYFHLLGVRRVPQNFDVHVSYWK